MPHFWLFILIVAVVAAVSLFFWWPERKSAPRTTLLASAKQRFHAQRERLEAKFVKLASAHLGANAPQWTDCNFDDDVAYVRSRSTGELSAFVAVTIASEEQHTLTQGSSEAVGNLQAGTAVFRFDLDHWETDGRAILNLSPAEAVRRFGGDLEIVSEDVAQRAKL